MNGFSNYLRLGYEHIVSLEALDHIVFLVALMAVYSLKHWLRIVIAATFFTVGHSITLSLGALQIVKVDQSLIEFLIPLTILLTALFNLTKAGQNAKNRSKYWLAGLFGLIHGLGFSNYYGMLTIGDSNYWQALLPFNLGVELGQLAVIGAILLVLLVYEIFLNKKLRDWNFFLSGAAFGLSFIMCLETWPFSV